MGTEAVWVPAVIAALGAGAGAYNTRQTAKDQDRAAAVGIQNQARRQREADDRVSAEVNALESSTPEAARKQATDAFMSQLRRSRGQAVAGGPAGASGRYAADLESATGDVDQYGAQVADTMGRINAPSLQRMSEGHRTGRLASDLSVIGRNAGGDAFLDQLRARSVRRNPWIDAGGELAQGVASGMASSSGRYGGLDPEGVQRVIDAGQRTYGAPPRAGVVA